MRWGVGLVLAASSVSTAGAQSIAAHAVAVWHSTNPNASGSAERRLQLVHPMISIDLPVARWLSIRATANAEGWTIPNGELVLGNWGEGFVDRRHPHTYLHELIADATVDLRCERGCRLGGFLGKGFVSFGSDDPMTRHPLRYPINHHLAQILERAVVGAQAQYGPVLWEATVFNGDEPERPGQLPRIGGRFGDSWATRLTVRPVATLDLTLSRASVASPEHRPGAGASQSKWHGAVRWSDGATTLFAEWARTSELGEFFVFETRLAEFSRAIGSTTVSLRLEQTTRPEEERQTATRSNRPHLENSILGTTGWSTATLTASRRMPLGRWSLSPLVELTYGRIAARTGVFDPRITYGRTTFVALSAGVRWQWGGGGHDVGRYALRRPAVGPNHRAHH